MPEDTAFVVPAFAVKPYAANAADDILQALRSIPYEGLKPPVGAISPQEMDQLLEWIVAGTVQTLEKIDPRRNRNWGQYFEEKCLDADLIANKLTSRLPQHYSHRFNMYNLSNIGHAAMIVHLPVTQTDAGATRNQWKHYLVDPTFWQFFKGGDAVEARLVATAEGKAFATQLLSRGYAELTEKTAQLYIGAFVPLPVLRAQHGSLLGQSHHSFIDLLSHPALNHADGNPMFGRSAASDVNGPTR